MIYRENGKKWTLPDRVCGPGYKQYSNDFYSYKVLGFRKPQKGEWYLSGAIIESYEAPDNLDTPYLVIEFIKRVKPITVWVEEG